MALMSGLHTESPEGINIVVINNVSLAVYFHGFKSWLYYLLTVWSLHVN